MWHRFNEPLESRSLLTDPLPPNEGCAAVASRFSKAFDSPFGNWSGSLYLPDSFSPTYEYPLICYLHGDDSSGRDLYRWFPLISNQNFIAVGIQAPFPSRLGMPGQLRWSLKRPDATAGVLMETFEAIQNEFLIHPDRVYLFGEGTGGIASLQMLLLQDYLRCHSTLSVRGAIARDLPIDWPTTIPYISGGSGRVLLFSERSTPMQHAAMDGLTDAGYELTATPSWTAADATCINNWILNAIPTVIV